jgi:hypothetical protein
MGVQVAITLDDQQKPAYVVSTVLAANFLVADEELILWIGNAHGGPKSFEVNAIKRVLEFIREAGTTTPTGANESYAEVATPGLKSAVNGAFDAAAALPEEAKVGVWYGPLFQPLLGSSITAHSKRALEKYLESTQKAA